MRTQIENIFGEILVEIIVNILVEMGHRPLNTGDRLVLYTLSRCFHVAYRNLCRLFVIPI